MRTLFPCYLVVIALLGACAQTFACGYNWVGECSTSIHLRINGAQDSFSVAHCPNGHLFNGLKLGSLKSLSLANAKAITWESCQNNVTAVGLRYRVYQVGTSPGAFQSLDLSEDFSTLDGAYTTRYRSQATDIDLTDGLSVGEAYVLEAYFWAEVDTLGDDFVPETHIVQDNGGQYYSMTFVYGGFSAPPFTAAFTENAGPTCAGGQNGSIAVGAWGDLSGVHYNWSNVALNFPQQVGLPVGTYTVTVTAGGHTEILQTTLTPIFNPNAYLSPLPAHILVTCNEPSVTICATAAPGVSYQWKKDGLIGPATPCIIATAGGIYTLSATEGGCSATATIVSEEHKVSPLASATGTGSYVLNCYEVDSTVVKYHVGTNAVNPTYEWYLQGQLISTESMLTLTFPGLMALSPTVKVSDQYGCSVEVPSFIILTSPPFPPYLYIDNSFDVCQPHLTKVTVQVTGGFGNGPFDITWDGQPVQGNQVYAEPGFYQVVATDQNGCSIAQTAIVSNVFSVNVQHAQFPNASNGSISINAWGGLSFQWADGNTSSYRYGLSAGTYCVTVSQWNSPCTLDTCIVVLGPSSIEELHARASMRVSPNPARAGGWSTVMVSGGALSGEAQAVLLDAQGRELWGATVFISKLGCNINWPIGLPEGLYTLRLWNAKGAFSGKIWLTE